MSGGMVERVAPAMAAADFSGNAKKHDAPVSMTAENYAEDSWRGYADLAGASIAAMRWPTFVVLQAGCDAAWPGNQCVYDDNFDGPESQITAAWNAMIAKALATPGTSS